MKYSIKLYHILFLLIIITLPTSTALHPIVKNEKHTIHSNPSDTTSLDQFQISVNDGNGLTLSLTNFFNYTFTDITINVTKTQGTFVHLPSDHFTIAALDSGDNINIQIPIFGIGLGIITKIPTLEIQLRTPIQPNIQLTIETKIFGRFTKIQSFHSNENSTSDGYLLFAPTTSTRTYLINNSGSVKKTWNSDYIPAKAVYLQEDGSLLRTAYPGPHPIFIAGGVGGLVEIIDLNDNIIWSYEYNNLEHCLHHDVEPLPNGNILMIAWEIKSYAEAIQAGRNPTTTPVGGLWADHIIEVKPTGPTTGEIVWEWHVWDHLIQDHDYTKENFGSILDHPERIDVNYGYERISDWNHINSIDYHPEFDQILLSVAAFNEIWIIDHSTTIPEAAGSSGGNSGKGGDILYRWGNPQTYDHGPPSAQQFYHQHDAKWIQPGYPGEGNILVFNNGIDRQPLEYSTVDEITPPVDDNGKYSYTHATPYGPTQPKWIYTAENPQDLFCLIVSGAQRLPNGNTLICDGPKGKFFEVTPEKNVIWEYSNPYSDSSSFNNVFKVIKYPPDYPGLQNII